MCIEQIIITPLDDCVRLSIKYKIGQHGRVNTFNRAKTIMDYLTMKYEIRSVRASQHDTHWVSVFIAKANAYAAVAFKLEFG